MLFSYPSWCVPYSSTLSVQKMLCYWRIVTGVTLGHWGWGYPATTLREAWTGCPFLWVLNFLIWLSPPTLPDRSCNGPGSSSGGERREEKINLQFSFPLMLLWHVLYSLDLIHKANSFLSLKAWPLATAMLMLLPRAPSLLKTSALLLQNSSPQGRPCKY